MSKNRYKIIILLISMALLMITALWAQDSGSPSDKTDIRSTDTSGDTVKEKTDIGTSGEDGKVAEKAAVIPDKPRVPEKPAADRTVKVEKKETAKPVVASDTAKKEPEPSLEEGQNLSTSLLIIDDEDFRNARIPDIGISLKRGAAAEDVIVKIPDEKSRTTESDETGQKGLFGLTGSTTDTAVRISLVLLIIVIVILYRMRSRGPSGKVMRNFPK